MSRLVWRLRYENLLSLSEGKLRNFLSDGCVPGVVKNQIGSVLLGRSKVSSTTLRAIAEYCGSQKVVCLAEEKLTSLGVTI